MKSPAPHKIFPGSFTAPDPLAGSLTDPAGGGPLSIPYISWLSPYAYCASDPINFTDPTGMYKAHNMDNMSCGILMIFPNSKLKYDKAKSINQDLKYYKAQGIPILEVDDVADLAVGLAVELGDRETIVFNSHGKEGLIRIGSEIVTTNTDLSNLSLSLSGKTVFLYSCRAGNGETGESFTDKMAEQMKCTVISPTHSISGGYDFNGGNGLNRSSEMDLSTIKDYRTFTLSGKGPLLRNIYNLKINRDGTITWTNSPDSIFDGFEICGIRFP